MAMGQDGINWDKLEKKVSCPVCLEVYRDPLQLVCGHSLCKRCADVLIQVNQISCPQCRIVSHKSWIRKNFDMEDFVSWFASEKPKICSGKCKASAAVEKSPSKMEESQNASASNGLNCELCELVPALIWCAKCVKAACASCIKIHAKVTNCTDKDTGSLESLQMRYARVLEEDENVFTALEYLLEEKLAAAIAEISAKRITMMEIIESAHLHFIDDTVQHLSTEDENAESHIQAAHVHFSKQFEMADKMELECRENARQTVERVRKELGGCKNLVTQLKANNVADIVRQHGKVRSKMNEMATRVKVLTIAVNNVMLRNLEEEAGFDLSKALQVIRITPWYFGNFLGHKLHMEIVSLNRSLYCKLLFVNGDLWCFGSSGIDVRSPETWKLLKNLDVFTGRCTGAVVMASGDVVAAGISGLKHIDPVNFIVKVIDNGRFYGVQLMNNGALVAIEECDGIINVVQISLDPSGEQMNVHLQKTKTKLRGRFGEAMVTFAVWNDRLYLASVKECSIFVMDVEGNVLTVLQRHDRRPVCNELLRPEICCIDSSGAMLVTDRGSNKLYVLQPEKNLPWTTLDLDKHILSPSAVAVDDSGRIFCVNSAVFFMVT